MSVAEDPFDMLKPIAPKQPEPEVVPLPEAASLDAFVAATSPPPRAAGVVAGLSEEAIAEKIAAAVGASPSPPSARLLRSASRRC